MSARSNGICSTTAKRRDRLSGLHFLQGTVIFTCISHSLYRIIEFAKQDCMWVSIICPGYSYSGSGAGKSLRDEL
ncbi:hypothetical protein HYPSUDRAFT_64249 [Hypholoma sublateritium FD-334 SS-4]|uniref:Uncharacterized protein n=1 Tax=Hypholoma sublateritium (strain FD-334 SS-4) TaxID=945553 RepID=A0A0D2LEQ8_HYPSF|nr:hypothetical protein HYPSUDRAFT_64249 [Hypholoma sublateritium FD-334 SS-4]